MTGKQQKYTRIGLREFVPFEFDEITFDVIDACHKYFAAHIDKDMGCDILAGERGPYCKRMCQIPDHKVLCAFHKRCLHRYPAAVYGFQNTRYPAV